MKSIVEKSATVWAMLGGVVLLAIVIVTTLNVGAFGLDKLARGFGGTVSGLPGYEDFVRLAIGAAALMFFPYCQLRRGHIAVDLFANAIPKTVQDALGRVWTGLILLLACFLAYWMLLGMLETRADGALSRVLGWSVWPFYIPGILSLILWAAVAALQIFRTETDG